MKNEYIPISCAFYDELEAAAVKRLINDIVYYTDDGIENSVKAKVVDFKTIEKQEFMILDNKDMIRLDKIISFNNLLPSDKNYC